MDQELKGESLESGAANYTTQVRISSMSPTSMTFVFQTLPGNQPNTFGNQGLIWANTDIIPQGAPPLALIVIPTNTSAGSVAVPGNYMPNSSYILGYSVGPGVPPDGLNLDICATSFIPAGWDMGSEVNQSGKVEVMNVGSTSIAFQLSDFPTQLGSAAWAGLWNGSSASYYTRPMAATVITGSSLSGVFSGINVMRGQTYSVGIMMSGWGAPNGPTQSSMACFTSFSA